MKLTYVTRQVLFTTLMAILSLPVFSQEGGSLRYFMQEGANSLNSIPYGNNASAGHYVQSGDAKIYYEVYGKGKPIVILHGGIVGSILEMGEFIDKLSVNNQVIAIATRGHGNSEIGHVVPSYEQKANDVLTVIESVTEEKVTILGFSDGAYTGYFFASEFPSKIDRLIAIGAGVWKKGFRDFSMTSTSVFAMDEQYWKQQMDIRPEPNRIDEWFESTGEYYNSLNVGEPVFEKIECPVLVLAGENDQNAPLQTVIEAYHIISNAQLSIIPQAPHPAFITNFPAVWASIVPFLTDKNINKSTENTFDQILTHHLTAFGKNDLETIVRDYTETSVIFTPNGTITGLANIRRFFQQFFATIPAGASFSIKQKNIFGNVAYIVWDSETDSLTIPMGTDTIVFDGDKIQYHTVADYRLKK
ncbi:alpha/beta fold hydrolase [Galbibacter sp. BG1]